MNRLNLDLGDLALDNTPGDGEEDDDDGGYYPMLIQAD
jgi:hypothetical protein